MTSLTTMTFDEYLVYYRAQTAHFAAVAQALGVRRPDVDLLVTEYTCAVCLEDTRLGTRLACGHTFHAACVRKQTRCPMCRNPC